MIDWEEQVKELRVMADELEQWALSSDGRQRLVLGRIADDLLRLSKEIEHVLEDETRVDTGDAHDSASIPDWLSDADVGRLVE